jgi:hypothetical protein
MPPATQQDLRSIISANDADSSPLAAPIKLETVFQTKFRSAYDETDGVVLLDRTGVDHRTLYNEGTASSVFVGANDAWKRDAERWRSEVSIGGC